MIKLLLADDEGIVLESMQRIVAKNFGDTCEVRTAKTGRAVIEVAEEFRPDIAILDIQMPGINGIEAIEEIKTFCPRTCFIIMSAYDTFDYAKKAMSLGVMDFITKPANTSRIRELLDIPGDYGMILVIEVGDAIENRKMTNVVGMSVKAQKFYDEFRQIVKEFFPATVGPVMTNKIVVYVPAAAPEKEYNERVKIIEKTDNMIQKLISRIELQFRAGVGSIRPVDDIYPSYQEACLALKKAEGTVMHINDLVAAQDVEENYPLETENAMYVALKRGDVSKTLEEAAQFFDWMQKNYASCLDDVRLKVLELVMYAERIAFHEGGMSYHFRDRTNYLATVTGFTTMDQLQSWFLDHMKAAAEIIHVKASEKYSDIVANARDYIGNNFQKDISLDEVSRVANVSPYYFSKIFKEETRETFVEYLTGLRMEHAKNLLREKEKSIKQICVESGYSDPNYFSRIFKKTVGVTPSEYREG